MNIFSRLLAIAITVWLPFTQVCAEPSTLTDPSEGLIWAGCGITKKAFMQELAVAYEKKTGVKIEIQGGGATRGIRDVQKGKIDIGGACRSTMEFNSKERFVKQIPVAWDAIVFIVNKDNPVDDISIEQVRQIYEGKITNWKQLGGNNAAIDLYVRKSPLSGVGYTLRELVFYDSDGDFTSRAHSVKSSGPAEKAVEKNPNAFTATGISSAHRRNVKLLKVNGTEPNFETIKSGSYILYRPLYLITKLVEKNPLVLDFIKYATSEEGMAVIRKTGTVPYSDALNLLSNQYRQNDRTM